MFLGRRKHFLLVERLLQRALPAAAALAVFCGGGDRAQTVPRRLADTFDI